jgi:hypothetical protein
MFPAASIVAMTVTPSFSPLSTAHDTDSRHIAVQVQIPPATERQLVSSMLLMLLRGISGD